MWYNGTYTSTGATGIALGTGRANTIAIINSQGNIGNYAAKICKDYDGGGYNDWFLPSKEELNKLHLSRDLIGGFALGFYWSSSEEYADFAWFQLFGDGYQGIENKNSNHYVRAVRAF